MGNGFTVLAGLPPYGPEAISFPAGQLLAQEGLVVRFDTPDNHGWVINFKKDGFDLDTVLEHPDGKRFVVCAGGNVYFVEPKTKTIVSELDCVTYAKPIADFKIIVFGNLDRFFAIDANGVRWTTPILGDGFQNIGLTKSVLYGEAYSTLDDKWNAFEVDLQTGNCKGTVYKEQLACVIPITRKESE